LYLSDDLEVRDTQKGMNWLYTAAVNGSHYAMYRLAKELLKGENIERDAASAVAWFTRSAERGNPCAQYMLGKLYLTGKEVPYDEEKAVCWLTQSAEQSNQYAEYLLPPGGKSPALCDAGDDPAAPPHELDLPGQLRPQVSPRRNPNRPQTAEKAAGEAHCSGPQAG